MDNINKLVVDRKLIENKFMKSFLSSKEGGVFLKKLKENNKISILLTKRLSTKIKTKPKPKKTIGKEICLNVNIVLIK